MRNNSRDSRKLSRRSLSKTSNASLTPPKIALKSILDKIGERSASNSYSRGSLHLNDSKAGQELRLEWENGISERWWQGLYRVISVKLKGTFKGDIKL
jgi:hypothetical protein